MTTTVYSFIVAFTVLSVILLVWRGITRLDKKGELEPPRPVVVSIGSVIAAFGVLVLVVAVVLGRAENPFAVAGFFMGLLRIPEILVVTFAAPAGGGVPFL